MAFFFSFFARGSSAAAGTVTPGKAGQMPISSHERRERCICLGWTFQNASAIEPDSAQVQVSTVSFGVDSKTRDLSNIEMKTASLNFRYVTKYGNPNIPRQAISPPSAKHRRRLKRQIGHSFYKPVHRKYHDLPDLAHFPQKVGRLGSEVQKVRPQATVPPGQGNHVMRLTGEVASFQRTTKISDKKKGSGPWTTGHDRTWPAIDVCLVSVSQSRNHLALIGRLFSFHRLSSSPPRVAFNLKRKRARRSSGARTKKL